MRGIHNTPATSAEAPANKTHVDFDTAMILLDLHVHFHILHEVLAGLE